MRAYKPPHSNGVDALDQYGLTPLMIAARFNQYEPPSAQYVIEGRGGHRSAEPRRVDSADDSSRVQP